MLSPKEPKDMSSYELIEEIKNAVENDNVNGLEPYVEEVERRLMELHARYDVEYNKKVEE